MGLGVVWRRRVRAALTELAHDLRDHVALTESPGGLYDDLRATLPASRPHRRPAAEHHDLLAEVDRLLDERDEGLEGAEAVATHREAATVLMGRLVRHRQRGSDLVFAAYEIDSAGPADRAGQ